LLVANDGRSCGHVARMIAIAGGLERVARERAVAIQTVLATTSQAHPLLASSEAVVVQLPAPAVARRAGFSDAERRRLVSGAIDGVARAFAPDLVVVDTFPLGPHRELVGASLGYARRALVRRHVPEAALAEPALADGLELMDLVVVADDPGPHAEGRRVPPITISRAPLTKADARRALALPAEGRVLLVAAGGGGDEEATTQATNLARALARIDAECTIALALGPLASARVEENPRLRHVQAAPLAPLLAAFDGALSPAGYNTTHELALAAVPAVLFAQKRPFDDQAARAARFGATVLDTFDDDAIRAALARMKPLRAVPRGGADRAAEALLDLVMA
jgi:predicted glycosyltransferase